MSTFQAHIELTDNLSSSEHCAASAAAIASIGRAVGQQVRIRRSAAEFALYTVRQSTQEGDTTLVRMSAGGLKRLGASEPIDGSVSGDAVDPVLADEADDV